MDSCVIFTLGLLWIMLPWMFVCGFLYEHMFSVLWGIYLAVQLLGRIVTPHTTLRGPAKVFLIMVYLLWIALRNWNIRRIQRGVCITRTQLESCSKVSIAMWAAIKSRARKLPALSTRHLHMVSALLKLQCDRLICLFKLHINGIVRYTPFCVLFLSCNKMHMKFTHVVCSSTLLIFIPV